MGVPAGPGTEEGPPAARGNVLFSSRSSKLLVPRPVGAGVLTILGGCFILLGGFAFALVGAVLAVLGFPSEVFLLGLLVGFLTIVLGFVMLAVPSGHAVWGILAIVFALVSLLVAFGGFLIGFLLTLIGGILAVTWKRPVDRTITVEARRLPPSGG